MYVLGYAIASKKMGHGNSFKLRTRQQHDFSNINGEHCELLE